MKKLKMGIIGVGGIAQGRHIPAYLNIPDKVEIIAVQDVDTARAEEVAKKFDIPQVFTDYHKLFSVVEAVTICTPNAFHAEITIAALEAGVHVLCEKPMAITAAECEAMIAAAEKANKVLSIGYHYRHLEVSQVAKRAVPDIGDPLVTRVQALRRRKIPGWGVFTKKELQGGGSLIDYGCHFLDLALWLLDNPKPVEVIGTTYNKLSKIPNQLNDWGTFDHETFDVDDHVSAYIKFEDGSSMFFECSWAANIKEDTNHLSISGVDGGLNVFPYEFYQPKHGTYMTTGAALSDNQQEAGLLQAENFVDACIGEAELISKPAQSLQVSKIIEAIYQSSEIGKSVRLG
ncbi:gfo/Idh/MocA family oxidoreductase [Oceanobacillus arenosus]|uniref:Gfo/Idh/MocA family oxidoreductase n=1 Tax=Oceanobacillus arenosus TaxID=1229153 RepID=A0A3D8PN70_9BACI|nr:Gfo/Idh/MocA family oxidoreductase [Oceanobacillus arenosus]RDW16967.1 gfo/Idh/MocA family oxidoreductase [Oceanobacillus arenosus]